MDVYEVRRQRLKELIQAVTQGNVAVFAGRFGYQPAQLSQYLSNTYNGGRSIGERAARALEQRVSAPVGWLDQVGLGIESDHPRAKYAEADAVVGAVPPYQIGNVPVLSIATTQEDGLVELAKAAEWQSPKMVPFATSSIDAYGILLKGSGLAPRHRSGEILIVDPSLTPEPGNDVLIYLVSDEHLVCQLLYKRGSEWTFGTVTGTGPNATVDEHDITEIAVIAGSVWPR